MAAHTITNVRSKKVMNYVDGSTDSPTQIVTLTITGSASYDTGGSALDVSAYGTYCYGLKMNGRTTIGNISRQFDALLPTNRYATGLKLQCGDAAGEIVAGTNLSGEVFLVDVEMGA